MSYQKLLQQMIGMTLVLLLLVGCGVPAATPVPSTVTPVPPTATPVPPTTTPVPPTATPTALVLPTPPPTPFSIVAPGPNYFYTYYAYEDTYDERVANGYLLLKAGYSYTFDWYGVLEQVEVRLISNDQLVGYAEVGPILWTTDRPK